MTSLNIKSMSMSGQLQLYVVASSEAGLHYTQYTASARGQDGGGGGRWTLYTASSNLVTPPPGPHSIYLQVILTPSETLINRVKTNIVQRPTENPF